MNENDIKNNVEFAQAAAIANGDLETVDALRDTGYVNDDLYKAMKNAFNTKNTTVSNVQTATKLSNMLGQLEPMITNTDDSEQGKAARFTAATEILKGYSDFARSNEFTDQDQQDFMTMLSKTLVDKNFSEALQAGFADNALREAMVFASEAELRAQGIDPTNPEIRKRTIDRALESDPRSYKVAPRMAMERADENARSFAVDVMKAAIVSAAAGDYEQAQNVLEQGNKEIIKMRASPFINTAEWARLERLYENGKPAPYEYMGKVYYFQGFTNKNAIFTTKVD